MLCTSYPSEAEGGAIDAVESCVCSVSLAFWMRVRIVTARVCWARSLLACGGRRGVYSGSAANYSQHSGNRQHLSFSIHHSHTTRIPPHSLPPPQRNHADDPTHTATLPQQNINGNAVIFRRKADESQT